MSFFLCIDCFTPYHKVTVSVKINLYMFICIPYLCYCRDICSQGNFSKTVCSQYLKFCKHVSLHFYNKFSSITQKYIHWPKITLKELKQLCLFILAISTNSYAITRNESIFSIILYHRKRYEYVSDIYEVNIINLTIFITLNQLLLVVFSQELFRNITT